MVTKEVLTPPVTTPDGWTRRGECNHCGWCCEFIGRRIFTITPRPAPGQREIDWDFLRVRGFNRTGVKASLPIGLHAPCWEHDVAAQRCKIHDTRPATCRAFPERPEQIDGTPCSYYFERVQPDGAIEQVGGDGAPFPGSTRLEED